MTESHEHEDPRLEPTSSPRWLTDAVAALDPPQADVDRLTRAVISSTRRITHPRRALHTDRADILVTDHVVRRLVQVRVRRALARPVLEVALTTDAGVVSAVRVGLAGRMGDDLLALADVARRAADIALTDSLGRDRGTASAAVVDVRWSDLVVGQAEGTSTESTR